MTVTNANEGAATARAARPIALRRPTFDELVIGGVTLVAWSLALLAFATGRDQFLNHDTIIERRTLPFVLTLALFLVSWQVMTGAMMLPTSMPMVRLFARASGGQARPHRVLVIFVAAYAAVWTGFAALALAFDSGIHALVDRWRWLDERPWLVSGTVLIIAGAFQFSPLKEQCLDACRHPASFLLRYYRRGVGAAWSLGIRHGLFCLGCCWALMLVMFGVGVGSLTWMGLLTGIMLIEKTSRRGKLFVPIVGALLLLWGGFTLLHLT